MGVKSIDIESSGVTYSFDLKISDDFNEYISLLGPSDQKPEWHAPFLRAALRAAEIVGGIEPIRHMLIRRLNEEQIKKVGVRYLHDEIFIVREVVRRAKLNEAWEVLPESWRTKADEYLDRLRAEWDERSIPPDGYVYIVRSESGFCKIGRSVDPNDRVKTFGVLLPFEVDFELLIPHFNHRSLERELHMKYASRRAGGEWFALTEEDINEIQMQYGGTRANR